MLKFLFKLLKFPADVKQAITCSTDDTCRLNENSRKKRVVCHLLMYIYEILHNESVSFSSLGMFQFIFDLYD